MKSFASLLIGILIITGLVVGFAMYDGAKPPSKRLSQPSPTPPLPSGTKKNPLTTIVTNLDTPWALAFLPNGDLMVTERSGDIKILPKGGEINDTPLLTIDEVKEIGEGGLLGIAVHPDYPQRPYVYVYYTYSGNNDTVLNRLVRYTFKNNTFSSPAIIIDSIPAASNHDGGRIKFGPDGLLYIATGDSNEPSLAQNRNSLAGKILRVTDQGKTPASNPFASAGGNSFVYSYGHRNPQGLAWNDAGMLFETEHGRSNPTGFDEVNLIESGKNYGWPTIQGDETNPTMVTPLINSGPVTTWAPSGAAFVGDSLFFSGLKGQTLYEAVIKNNRVSELKKHLVGMYGRLRDVIVGPDGMLYVTTSNQDGRGTPTAEDDRIIRIDPAKL